MVFIGLAALLIALLTLAELRSGGGLRADHALNCSIWALRLGLGKLVSPLVALSVPVGLIDGAALPFAFGFILYALAMDLGEYLFHRAQHAIPWMWKLHALHHSDADMNATTTERHFWGDQFLKAITIWPAAALLVHPTPGIVVAYFAISMWNYVCHARLRLDFGRWSWLLNSPAYHRRHHSSLEAHFNSNYAALLPIWDLLLGSYNRPDGFPSTGLDYAPKNIADVLAWPFVLPRRHNPQADPGAQVPAR